MNEEMIDLSHRAVACKSWRWVPGMRTDSKFARVVAVDSDSDVPCAAEEGATNDDCHAVWLDGVPLLPDLTDPATLGCLLSLAREAWVDPTASTAATREVGGTRGWIMDCWDPKSPLNGIGPFKSEAEAIIAALEAAP